MEIVIWQKTRIMLKKYQHLFWVISPWYFSNCNSYKIIALILNYSWKVTITPEQVVTVLQTWVKIRIVIRNWLSSRLSNASMLHDDRITPCNFIDNFPLVCFALKSEVQNRSHISALLVSVTVGFVISWCFSGIPTARKCKTVNYTIRNRASN